MHCRRPATPADTATVIQPVTIPSLTTGGKVQHHEVTSRRYEQPTTSPQRQRDVGGHAPRSEVWLVKDTTDTDVHRLESKIPVRSDGARKVRPK